MSDVSLLKEEIIGDCGLFEGLSEASLAKIIDIATIARFSRGDLILRDGEECPGIYVVGRGMVRVFKIAPSGKEHVLHFARPGTTIAEVAVIGRFRCPAFAEASEDTVCALIPVRGLQDIIDTDHAFCIEMMVGMSRWIRVFVGLLEDLALRDATARVARHLIDADPTGGTGEFALPMRKKDLASHLNLTSETLSRTLHRLVECDLIESRDGRIRILGLEELQDVADGLAPAEFS